MRGPDQPFAGAIVGREHRPPVRVYLEDVTFAEAQGDTALVSPGGRPRRLRATWARIFTGLIHGDPTHA